MPAKFTLTKDKAGKFRFTVIAANGQVIAQSEMYNSKQAAQDGIASVKANAPDAAVDDRTAE